MKILVYGTLKKDFGNHGLLKDCQLLDRGFYEIDNCNLRANDNSPFPYLHKEEGNNSTKFFGEIYAINDHVLKNLDILEGHPSFYTREFIEHLNCFTYTYKHDHAKELGIIKNFQG